MEAMEESGLQHEIGSRVVVTAGQLAGLTGEVIGITDGNNCCVRGDSFGEGASIVISSEALQLLEPPAIS